MSQTIRSSATHLFSARRSVSVCAGVTMVEHFEGNLIVPRTAVELVIAEIFSALDDYK